MMRRTSDPLTGMTVYFYSKDVLDGGGRGGRGQGVAAITLWKGDCVGVKWWRRAWGKGQRWRPGDETHKRSNYSVSHRRSCRVYPLPPRYHSNIWAVPPRPKIINELPVILIHVYYQHKISTNTLRAKLEEQKAKRTPRAKCSAIFNSSRKED